MGSVDRQGRLVLDIGHQYRLFGVVFGTNRPHRSRELVHHLSHAWSAPGEKDHVVRIS